VQKLSKTLKELIKSNNLNTLELSRLTGVSQPVIYRIISGETFDPKISTLCSIADYFGITVNQLLGDSPFGLNPINKSDEVFENIPLLKWDEITKNLTDRISAKGLFTVKMTDDSMEPLFLKDTFLIFDTNKKPKDNSYVLVHVKTEDKILFRQLQVVSRDKYLRPFNPNSDKYKIKVFSKYDKIYGVLVQARRNFQV
jgi:transcriptional regulator with XRE-family HTH domain